MGDGNVALIIDVLGLSDHMGLHRVSSESEFDEETKAERLQSSIKNMDVQDFVIVKVNNDSLHAIPRCLVHRLEEIPKRSIEFSCNKKIVQYRGSVMPIISLNKLLDYEIKEGDTSGEVLNLVVISRGGRSFGIEVDEIVDVVTLENNIDEYLSDQSCVLGNVLENNQVYIIIDVYKVIESEFKEYAGTDGALGVDSKEAVEEILKNEKIHILYAEDVAFFRKNVAKVLQAQGFEVITAKDGVDALKVLESELGKKISLVLSDIEMPNMDGIELAKRIKENWPNLPLMALTTKYKKSDIEEGIAAGFTQYLEKLDAKKLLDAVFAVFGSKIGAENKRISA